MQRATVTVEIIYGEDETIRDEGDDVLQTKEVNVDGKKDNQGGNGGEDGKDGDGDKDKAYFERKERKKCSKAYADFVEAVTISGYQIIS